MNSPVRAYGAVGGTPPVIDRAVGASITDVDGNTYVDYVCGYGPAILGHAHERVVTAINKAVRKGVVFGAPCVAETKLAEAIVAAVDSIENVRFVSSGTEAVMSAVRLARAATGRDKIIKAVGCYHGHSDAMLVSAGSGAATLGVPSSPGVTCGAAADTIAVGYNDLDAARQTFSHYGDEIAAVLVEPVAGNMGVIPPAEGYLEGLRQLCDEHSALLIFDEVITGFRVSYGGAQKLYGVRPDLTTLGKIIGGGLPVGALGGPKDLMKELMPLGKVYQAGTLSGSPAAMAAGLAVLQVLQEKGFYNRLEKISAAVQDALEQAAVGADVDSKICINRVASMMCCFFNPGPVRDFASAGRSNTDAYASYMHKMLAGGVYLAPSQYEAMFVSAAHGPDDVSKTQQAAEAAFADVAKLM